MGARRIRREQRDFDQKLSRRVNGMRKTKERARRDARMAELVKKGTFPYTPSVRSWLGEKLDKPTTAITQADVDGLMKKG